MLNSAAGVTFPPLAPPPMRVTEATRLAIPGSARSASAMLVSGPTGTRWRPSSASVASTMTSTASSESGARSVSGRSTSARPVMPCTCLAWNGSATIGRAAPWWTGTSMPRRSRIRSALAVVCSTPTFPETVVMATRSVQRAAVMIAMASSTPGSQSRMIRGRSVMGEVLPGWLIAGSTQVDLDAAGSPRPQHLLRDERRGR